MKKHSLFMVSVFLSFCLLATAVLSAQAQRQKTLKEETVSVDSILLPTEKNASYYFLQALSKANAQQTDSALLLLNHALTLNPNEDAALYYRAKLLLEENKDSLALADIEKAVKISDYNEQYQSMLGFIYAKNNNLVKASQAFEKIIGKTPTDRQILNVLRRIYEQTNSSRELLAVLDKLEEAGENGEEFFLDRLNAYQWNNDSKGAYRFLVDNANKYAHNLSYKVMLGNWLMQQKQTKKAYKVYQEVWKQNPQNEELLEALYDYYTTTGNNTKAKEMQMNMLLSASVSYNTKASLFKDLYNKEKSTAKDSLWLIPLLNKMIAVAPKEKNLYLLKGAYLELQRAPISLQQQEMKSALKLFPEIEEYRLALVEDAWKNKNFALVESLAKDGVKISPAALAFYYYLGLNYGINNNPEAALNVFLQGINNAPETADSKLIASFYSLVGDLYLQLKQSEKGFKAYQISIEKDAENAGTLNNYAYFLALESNDLAKAEALSEKAIKIEANNSTYLDTYAYILLKQKKLAEAKQYIDKALELEPKDSINVDILNHAGDIYKALNKQKEAISFWQEALKQEPNNTEIKNKIEQR